MLIVPSSPSTRSTSSRWSGEALSASIRSAILRSRSGSLRSFIGQKLRFSRVGRVGGGTNMRSARLIAHRGTNQEELHHEETSFNVGAGSNHDTFGMRDVKSLRL